MFWMFAKNTSRVFAPKGEFGYLKNLVLGEIENYNLSPKHHDTTYHIINMTTFHKKNSSKTIILIDFTGNFYGDKRTKRYI